MIHIVLVFDPDDADDDDPTDVGIVKKLAEHLNLEVARMSSAYQGFRIEEEQ